MRSGIRAAMPVAIGFILACASDPSSPPDHTGPITIAPLTQWSGGTVTATSDQLLDFPGTPVITGGTDTLAFTQADDTTITITLPSVPSGLVELVLHGTGSDSLVLGEVEVVGFSGVHLAERAVGGDATPWPSMHPTGILGIDINENVAFLDATTGAVTTFGVHTPPNLFYAPGTSYRPDIIVNLASPTGGVVIWKLDMAGSAIVLDSIPLGYGDRKLFELAPSTWLQTNHHGIWIYKSVDNGATYTYPYREDDGDEEAWAVVYSPDRKFGVVLSLGTDSGAPVFDLTTGGLIYRVPSILRPRGAAFTDDGELYLSGSDRQTGSILRLDAATGNVIDSVGIGKGESDALAWDSQTDWIFLMNAHHELRIYDRSLKPVATLQVPEGVALCTGCFHAFIIPDAGHRKVRVIWEVEPTITTFDLLPTP